LAFLKKLFFRRGDKQHVSWHGLEASHLTFPFLEMPVGLPFCLLPLILFATNFLAAFLLSPNFQKVNGFSPPIALPSVMHGSYLAPTVPLFS